MSVKQFDQLHDLLKPKLLKTSYRPPLPTELRLAVCLSYLAHGDSVTTTSWHFRIGRSTMYSIIPEVCNLIWDILQPIYLRCPQQEDEWKQIADDFYTLRQLPNCIGAIDGKHVRIQAPANSGTAFHNYKGYFSFVLMAVCDAHYRFTWVDLGDYGSLNDAGIWSNTTMYKALENDELSLPIPRPLPNTTKPTPFFLIGDEGFPLKIYLLRPYARRNLAGNLQRVFNYRLSRARRMIENTFGILVSKWAILQGSMKLKTETAESIVQACCCLHNFIITTKENNQYLHGVVNRDGSNNELTEDYWDHLPQGLFERMGRLGANNGSVAAMRLRDHLAEYFISEQGSIPWQWDNI